LGGRKKKGHYSFKKGEKEGKVINSGRGGILPSYHDVLKGKKKKAGNSPKGKKGGKKRSTLKKTEKEERQ